MKKTNTRGSTPGWFDAMLAVAVGAAEGMDDKPSSSSSSETSPELNDWYNKPSPLGNSQPHPQGGSN